MSARGALSPSPRDQYLVPSFTAKLSARVAPSPLPGASKLNSSRIAASPLVSNRGAPMTPMSAHTPISASARAAWFDEDAMASRAPSADDEDAFDMMDRFSALAGHNVQKPTPLAPPRRIHRRPDSDESEQDSDEDGIHSDMGGDPDIGGIDDDDIDHLRQQKAHKLHPLDSLLSPSVTSPTQAAATIAAANSSGIAFRKVGAVASPQKVHTEPQSRAESHVEMLATTPSTASSHSYLFNTDMQGNVKREHSVVAMSEIIEDDEPEGEIHAAARFAMQENDDFQIPVQQPVVEVKKNVLQTSSAHWNADVVKAPLKVEAAVYEQPDEQDLFGGDSEVQNQKKRQEKRKKQEQATSSTVESTSSDTQSALKKSSSTVVNVEPSDDKAAANRGSMPFCSGWYFDHWFCNLFCCVLPLLGFVPLVALYAAQRFWAGALLKFRLVAKRANTFLVWNVLSAVVTSTLDALFITFLVVQSSVLGLWSGYAVITIIVAWGSCILAAFLAFPIQRLVDELIETGRIDSIDDRWNKCKQAPITMKPDARLLSGYNDDEDLAFNALMRLLAHCVVPIVLWFRLHFSAAVFEVLSFQQRQAELLVYEDVENAQKAKPMPGFRVVESSVASTAADTKTSKSENVEQAIFTRFGLTDPPPRGDTLLVKIPNLTITQLAELLPWCYQGGVILALLVQLSHLAISVLLLTTSLLITNQFIPPPTEDGSYSIISIASLLVALNTWSVVFLCIKATWSLLFIVHAVLLELPFRQRNFSLFSKWLFATEYDMTTDETLLESDYSDWSAEVTAEGQQQADKDAAAFAEAERRAQELERQQETEDRQQDQLVGKL